MADCQTFTLVSKNKKLSFLYNQWLVGKVWVTEKCTMILKDHFLISTI